VQEVGEDKYVEASTIRRSGPIGVSSSGLGADRADVQSEDAFGILSPFIPDNFDVHIRTQECAIYIDRLM